jgi:hypothetical protein
VLEGESGHMKAQLQALSPAVIEELPLDFEETFIHDVKRQGGQYDEF